MSAEDFQVASRSGTSEGVQILDFDGPITYAKSGVFQEAIARATGSRLILDLTDVPSLDSMAVGVLVRAYVTCHKAGRSLALVGLSQRVRNVLQLTGIDPLFETYASVADAEQSLH
jgi:anti-sigma B factor antagonist